MNLVLLTLFVLSAVIANAEMSVKKLMINDREFWCLVSGGQTKKLFPGSEHYRGDRCTVLGSPDGSRLCILHFKNRRESSFYLLDKSLGYNAIEVKSDFLDLTETEFALASINFTPEPKSPDVGGLNFGVLSILLSDNDPPDESHFNMEFQIVLSPGSAHLRLLKCKGYANYQEWLNAHPSSNGWQLVAETEDESK